ncbi:ABC transporter substrate-binding protein [Streptomyces tendae]|uniref:ABC transporter substrate-binding protein n=1 Tax=Streptomyces tendae TaxID=1932 RepID=UPI0036CF10A3
MRRRFATIGSALALLVGLSACSTSVQVRELSIPEGLHPEAGTGIPKVTVDAGWSPIGDGLIPVVGERRGYFEDAGIEFSRPNGYKSNLLSSMTPILNGQIDIGDTYMPLLTPQMSTVRSVTTFAIPTTAHVQRILAPKGKYKTLDALMAQGLSFEEAGRQVMEQLRGKTLMLFTGIDPQFYTVSLELAGMTLDDVDTVYMGDPDMVTAAHSGRGDFASPNGAVQVSQLQSSGWEPIITITDVLDHLPDKTLNMANTYTGFLTTKQFANENYNTLLRFTSVLFRISRAFGDDPIAACADYVDYVNSYTGSALTPQECAKLYDGIYELNGFEDYQDVVGPGPAREGTDYLTETDAQIARLQKQEVLPRGNYAATDISIAHRIHWDLRAYRDEAKKLLAAVPDGKLRDRAEKYYADFNFLDAYRFALAAQKEMSQ